MNNLIDEFNRDMVAVYTKAKKECNYNATRYLQMISEYGGLATAKKLLADNKTHDGLTALYLCNRLDLTVEALVIKEKYKKLFTEEELKTAEKRLCGLNYQGQSTSHNF